MPQRARHREGLSQWTQCSVDSAVDNAVDGATERIVWPLRSQIGQPWCVEEASFSGSPDSG